VIASILRAAAWVLRYAARLRRIGLVLRGPPIGGPFPDVADHVVEAVAVWWECGHRRGALVAVECKVLARKIPLPSVGHLTAVRSDLIAPGELGLLQSAACGNLPFRLGRQPLAHPFRVGLGVAIGYVDDRMIVEAADR